MPYASIEEKRKSDREYYLRLSDKAMEKRRRYNREYQRKRRIESPLHMKAIRKAYHLRHPDARTIWNAKRSSEYLIWTALKQRCLNPDDKGFKNYGARGIMVCKRWQKSFDAFLADMGRRPSNRHSIDRFPNNAGNYEPGNCRWATLKEQARNKRTNKVITYKGKTQCLTDWADETGIHPATLSARAKRGLTGKLLFEKAEWPA